MHSCFFTLEEHVSPGIEVSRSARGVHRYISVGGAETGIRVPVATRTLPQLDHVEFGRVIDSPRIHIEPLRALPRGVKPHAVVLVRRHDISLGRPWSNFPLPANLQPKSGPVSKAKPAEIGCGFDIDGSSERTAVLVSLPPDTAIIVPILVGEPKVVLWLGSGKPLFYRHSVLKTLQRAR